MSYDIKLVPTTIHRVLGEDHLVEDDQETVVLNFPTNNTNVKVRINDFERQNDFQSEMIKKEIVTQFQDGGTIILVKSPPLYDGLKIGRLATSSTDVIVKIKIQEEDVSSQFTGTQNYFILQNVPLLRANRYDFNYFLTSEDLDYTIFHNLIDITNEFTIVDIDPLNGKVQFDKIVPAGSIVLVTYFYSADVINLDALNGKVTISQSPPTYYSGLEVVTENQLNHFPIISGSCVIHQDATFLIEQRDYILDLETGEIQFRIDIGSSTITATYSYTFVEIQYFQGIQYGWFLNKSTKSKYANARDVVFYQPQNTNRILVTRENVSNQFSYSVLKEVTFTSVSGGETGFGLKHQHIVDGSYFIYRNNNLLTDLIDYTLDIQTGFIHLNITLIIGDIITSTYSYRTIDILNFKTKFTPLLPLYNNFYDIYNTVLNNAVLVYKIYTISNEKITRIKDNYQLRNQYIIDDSYTISINGRELLDTIDYTLNLNSGIIQFLINITSSDLLIANYQYEVRIGVSSVNPNTGEVTLFNKISLTDTIAVTYYYQNSIIFNRISIDYQVDAQYDDKNVKSNYVDYKIDSSGQYIKVFVENKLIQDIIKIIETVLNSDPIATWYGTTFFSFIGSAKLPDYVTTRISTEIINALTKLKNAQVQQNDYQTLDPREFLDFIQALTVNQDSVNPTLYTAIVNIVTQAGSDFTIDQPIQLKQ